MQDGFKVEGEGLVFIKFVDACRQVAGRLAYKIVEGVQV